MKKKVQFLTGILLAIICLAALSTAQEPVAPKVPKRISKGVINGSAITLTVPKYPAAAMAVNATGVVSVSVMIGFDGEVLHAAAVSGHPLLRQASVDAALTSKFKPTLLAGQPVEVSGVIVYNYAGPPKPFDALTLGFAIEYLKNNSDEFTNGVFRDAVQNVPSSLVEVKADLKLIADYFQYQLKDASKISTTTGRFVIGNSVNTDPVSEGQQSTDKNATANEPMQTKSFQIARGSSDSISTLSDPVPIAISLDTRISTQLERNEDHLWRYKVGKTAAALVSSVGNNTSFAVGVDSIKTLLASSPGNMTNDLTEELMQNIVNEFENPNKSLEERQSIIAAICKRFGR